MRIFYVFNIKKEVYEIYRDTPSVIYNFFNQLYYFKKDNLDYGNTIFKQVANRFNKEALDLKLYIRLHNKMRYIKRGDEHIINNLYKDEISIMKIKKSYIVINTNNNFTEFFEFLNEEYRECFVCDFVNQDYFYLRSLKMLV